MILFEPKILPYIYFCLSSFCVNGLFLMRIFCLCCVLAPLSGGRIHCKQAAVSAVRPRPAEGPAGPHHRRSVSNSHWSSTRGSSFLPGHSPPSRRAFWCSELQKILNVFELKLSKKNEIRNVKYQDINSSAWWHIWANLRWYRDYFIGLMK